MRKFLGTLLLFATAAFGQFTESQSQYFPYRNFITNPGAEQGASGCTAYADAAATSPVDGTGGSPTTTWTVSSSSPLNGTRSFLLTKDAANRQGEGSGCAFSLPASEKTHVQRISFNYAVSSGTFSYGDGTVSTPSDVRVYIYDVTNSSLIEPQNTLLDGSGKFRSEFQAASNSTSYRLIFHVATTSASAWALKFDNIQVGPRDIARGAIVTDWTNFTPTGSWTSNTTYTGYWRRVGDTMEVQFKIALSGAPTSAALSIDLPSGYSIDLSKLAQQSNGGNIFGSGQYVDSSASSVGSFNITSKTSTATSVAAIYINSSPPSQSGVDATHPVTWASGDFLSGSFQVPILGWGSNTVTTADSGTRAVVASFSLAANQTGVNPNNSSVKVALDTVAVDTVGGWDSANKRYVVKESGNYSLDASILLSTTNVLANYYELKVIKNGSTTVLDQEYKAVATTGFGISSSKKIPLVAGDYLELFLFGTGDNSASTLTVQSGSGTYTFFSLAKIQSPQTLGMADAVVAKYESTQSTALSGTDTRVNFDTKIKDSFGAVTTGSSWEFTAPMSGTYKVSAQIQTSSTAASAATNQYFLLPYVNGSAVGIFASVAGSTTAYRKYVAMPATIVVLNAGDTLDIRVSASNSGDGHSLSGVVNGNSISIERVGN